MKVLVVSSAGSGHVNPLIPLVKALVAQGDEVVVAANDDPGAVVVGSGATFRHVGHGDGDWFGTLRSRTRGMPGDGLPPERVNHYFVPRLFGEVATEDMIDGVVQCGRELGPDLALFETYAFAGPLAAQILGVPGVHHLISPMLPHEVMVLVNDAVSPLWRSFGHDAPGYGGIYHQTTIEVSPPSLEPLDVPGGELLAMRGAPLPATEPHASEPPLVYVTLGSFFGMNTDVFRGVIEALAAEPVEVVVTVGADKDPAALGPVPPNTRVERFIPQGELMPRCSVVVHHGGSGTMFGALAHGLPQVILPQGADNFANADHVAGCGAGLSIGSAELSPSTVKDAVRSVIDEPRFGEAARRVAAEMAAMPSPQDVAVTLRTRYGAR